MLVKRLKLFNRIDKIVHKQARRFLKDFGNANDSYKNLKIINNLSDEEKEILLKKFPNYLTNKGLQHKNNYGKKFVMAGKGVTHDSRGLSSFINGEIDVPEDVWNVIKKAGYFNEGDAAKVTRQQFRDSLNKHFNFDKLNPEAFDRFNKRRALQIGPKESESIYNVFNGRERQHIVDKFNNGGGKDISSKDYVNFIKNDNEFKNTGGTVFNSKYLGPGDEVTFPYGIEENAKKYFEEAKKNGTFDKEFENAKEVYRKLSLDSYLQEVGVNPIAFADKNSEDVIRILVDNGMSKKDIHGILQGSRYNTAAAENFDKIAIGKPSIALGNRTTPGLAFHEEGHALDAASNPVYNRYNKGFRKMYENTQALTDEEISKMEKSVTIPEVRLGAGIDDTAKQLGNEGMASLIGSRKNKEFLNKLGNGGKKKRQRKKSIKKAQEQATKNRLDAFSTYVQGNGESLLSPKWLE